MSVMRNQTDVTIIHWQLKKDTVDIYIFKTASIDIVDGLTAHRRQATLYTNDNEKPNA